MGTEAGAAIGASKAPGSSRDKPGVRERSSCFFPGGAESERGSISALSCLAVALLYWGVEVPCTSLSRWVPSPGSRIRWELEPFGIPFPRAQLVKGVSILAAASGVKDNGVDP